MAADGDETRVYCSGAASNSDPTPGELRRGADPSSDKLLEPLDAVAERSTTLEDEPSGSVGRDPMVKIELDAAHALAEFAQLALMASRGLECRRGAERKWGRRRCRTAVRRRRAEIWGKSFQDFNKPCSWQDAQVRLAVLSDIFDISFDFSEVFMLSPEAEIASLFPSASFFFYNLVGISTAEKEERRLRRIQANRESARQTIRRRQALCEELTKKATDLSLENKKIKQEMEFAMQEYLSLVDTNKRLKEQIAESDKYETKDNQSHDIRKDPSEDSLCKPETAAPSSVQFPLLVYNGTPFAQFTWPSVQPQPIRFETTSLSATCTTNPPHGRVTFGGQNGSRPQLFLVPCPLIYSVNDQVSCPMPAIFREGDGGSNNTQRETDLSPKLTGDIGPNGLHGKTSTSSSMISIIKKEDRNGELMERASASLADGGNHVSGFHSKALALIPIVGTNDPSNHENFVLADLDSKEHVSPLPQCSILHSSTQFQDKHKYNKRLTDAAAATEARKRRKELTKLKSLHSRQLKLQC
ncbi:Transcription factor HBP-1a [Nymphaea thermarum]|nr:Transcription factor HBP-1a [Nymphaea thermarum]